MQHIKDINQKLRSSGLRPTRQRVKISEILFKNKETFHFTVEYLEEKINKKFKEKISLATIYNTVHAFQKKGYIKKFL